MCATSLWLCVFHLMREPQSNHCRGMVSLGCSMAVILMCMCGHVIYNGVGVVSKGSSMRLNGPEVLE